MAGVLIGERWARTGHPCGAHGVGPRGVARDGPSVRAVCYPVPGRPGRVWAALPGPARCERAGQCPPFPIRTRLVAR